MANTARVISATTAAMGATDRQVAVRAMRTGVWAWPSFLLLDAYMCFVAYPGAPFGLFVIYRAVVEAVILVGLRAALREDADVARLLRWQGMIFCLTALTIALMAIHLGGVRSPYMHGISIVALVWAALVPMQWRRALPTFLGIGLAFPLVMGLYAAVSPTARAEWINADALTVFAANYVFVLASAALGLTLTNMVWRAQQQVLSLGSYRLEEVLGRGGMGEVWRARHKLLARQAAIKLVRPDAVGGDAHTRQAMLARFEREAQVTATLRSPHTIEVYDFGISDQGVFYYVMELLNGFDAAQLVERFGPLPAERAVHLLLQMCDSLGEAHAAGMVHRDVKPSNLYVCRYGRAVDFVKVLDFGLVKPRHVDGFQLTADQVVSGTPAFMSPEQVLGGKELDGRSDLYAVGCVAYWLLTAQWVFTGGNAIQVMMAHARAAPVPPSQRTELPIAADLEGVVMACLEKNPANRPPSADALADALANTSVNGAWTQALARRWWDRHAP